MARKRPCAECPWRRDTDPGQFPAIRYEALRETTGERGREAPLGSSMFACHKSTEDDPLACAGWLAAVGYENLTARLLIAQGAMAMPEPDASWPPLFESYDGMASVQAGEP